MSLLAEPANPLPLRDYQQIAIDNLRASLRSGHRRPLLASPTGSGKTRLAGEIFRMAREKDKRVVFTVPRIDLVDQTLRSFWRDGIADVGVIQASHEMEDWSRPVQIASIQTIARRSYPKADLVIVDEAHLAFKALYDWMAHPEWQRVPFIGLSATPWTKGLGKHFDDLIIVATTARMIEQGFLCDFRVFAPSHPDLRGVKLVAGDYHEGQLSEAMQKPLLVADVVQTWMLRGEGRPTLVFAVDRAHAKALQKRFMEAGISAGYQDAFTPKDQREEVRRSFETGRYAVVVSVDTLALGVDWDVRCISLARPTHSIMRYIQIIGRGLRPKKGDPNDCLILDHSDNTLRLGFVTDIHRDKLDDGKRAAAEKHDAPLPRECTQCQFVYSRKLKECPNCGHKPAAPVSTIEPAEGELVELKRRGGTLPVSSNTVRIMGKEMPLANFYAELLYLAEIKGYKRGWAWHRFTAAVGHSPPNGMYPTPMTAGYEVTAWANAHLRRYARSQR